jgi:DNA-binding protein YbaB
MRKVIYGANKFDIEDNSLSAKEIQVSMSELFPELKNATFTEDAAGNITFTVKAGTKGMAEGPSRKVIYGSNKFDIEDASLSAAQIQASMSELFPELKNASYVEDKENNTITFTVKAGTKGMARKVIYGSNKFDIEDDSLTAKEIQASMSELFPELKNATFVEGDGQIVFTVKAGTKGMANGPSRKVIYGSNKFDIEDASLSASQIQASMSELFPELKNASFVEDKENNTITFTVKAGTKGMARKVIYGSNKFDIEDDSLSAKEIQVSMSELFPELKNATFSEADGQIIFTVKAGTKGMARKVIYGSNKFDIEDDSLSAKEIQASMSELFPELKNATFEEHNGQIVFTVKAGTKGARFDKLVLILG